MQRPGVFLVILNSPTQLLRVYSKEHELPAEAGQHKKCDWWWSVGRLQVSKNVSQAEVIQGDLFTVILMQKNDTPQDNVYLFRSCSTTTSNIKLAQLGKATLDKCTNKKYICYWQNRKKN